MNGPTPPALCLSALASCTAATLRMYAEHQNLALGEITVEVTCTAPTNPCSGDCGSPRHSTPRSTSG